MILSQRTWPTFDGNQRNILREGRKEHFDSTLYRYTIFDGRHDSLTTNMTHFWWRQWNILREGRKEHFDSTLYRYTIFDGRHDSLTTNMTHFWWRQWNILREGRCTLTQPCTDIWFCIADEHDSLLMKAVKMKSVPDCWSWWSTGCWTSHSWR